MSSRAGGPELEPQAESANLYASRPEDSPDTDAAGSLRTGYGEETRLPSATRHLIGRLVIRRSVGGLRAEACFPYRGGGSRQGGGSRRMAGPRRADFGMSRFARQSLPGAAPDGGDGGVDLYLSAGAGKFFEQRTAGDSWGACGAQASLLCGPGLIDGLDGGSLFPHSGARNGAGFAAHREDGWAELVAALAPASAPSSPNAPAQRAEIDLHDAAAPERADDARSASVRIHFGGAGGVLAPAMDRVKAGLRNVLQTRFRLLAPEEEEPAAAYAIRIDSGVPHVGWFEASRALALAFIPLKPRSVRWLNGGVGGLDAGDDGRLTGEMMLEAVHAYCRWSLRLFASATGEALECRDDVLAEIVRHLRSLAPGETRAPFRYVAGLARRITVFQAARKRGMIVEPDRTTPTLVISSDALVFARLHRLAAAEREILDQDLSRLGGVFPTLYLVLDGIGAENPRDFWRDVRVDDGVEENLLDWSTWLADSFNVEIEVGESPGLDACMVRTRRSTAICLGDHLGMTERVDGILHELGHLQLKHLPNTSYGMDPARLAPGIVRRFEEQEREADAVAVLYRYVFTDLTRLARSTLRTAETCDRDTSGRCELRPRDACRDPFRPRAREDASARQRNGCMTPGAGLPAPETCAEEERAA